MLAEAQTPTGILIEDCTTCGCRHAVTRKHCPICGLATLFNHGDCSPECSPETLRRLEWQRAKLAELANRLALGALEAPSPDVRGAALESLRQARHSIGKLDQQIAWYRRRQGWSWPTGPAWTD